MYSRPLLSRTQTYLYPYIKYNYGIDMATLFHSVRPFDSRILLIDESKPISFENLKGVICLFESADNLSTLEKHPCFMEYNSTYGYPAIVFKYEDDHAFNHFVLGNYSKMYPTFIDKNKEHFFNEYMGVTLVSLIYEVCKQYPNRRYKVASELKIQPDQLKELDSKPNFNEEILLSNQKHFSKWENLSSPSPSSSACLSSLLESMNKTLQENLDLLQ